jgi:hypothetical protein
VIDAIDEMIIHQVKRYAIVNAATAELDYIKLQAAKKG